MRQMCEGMRSSRPRWMVTCMCRSGVRPRGHTWIPRFGTWAARAIRKPRGSIARRTNNRLGLTDLISCEVLERIRSEHQFNRVRTELLAFQLFDTGGEQLGIASPRNLRRIRERGRTVRKTIECLIATFCLAKAIHLCIGIAILKPLNNTWARRSFIPDQTGRFERLAWAPSSARQNAQATYETRTSDKRRWISGGRTPGARRGACGCCNGEHCCP